MDRGVSRPRKRPAEQATHFPKAGSAVYQVGNWHLALELTEGGLKTLYDPVLASYLGQQGIPGEQSQLPFTAVSAVPGPGHA
jgi:urease accessory protein UreE